MYSWSRFTATACGVLAATSVADERAPGSTVTTARSLVAWWDDGHGPLDLRISRLAARWSPLWYHQPSLVQHRAVESTWGGAPHSAVEPRVNLYPIEAAIVNACHSGQGGTGDVAILTAANRMQLMPFAQIATRIGGAITVTLALLVLKALG